ncbi:MAG: glycosyltransferase family 4 protein [Phycisphaerales bacterium]|jgi:glycosyltransferase involved in cell wall biosynthesis|nr:glycosyltransferase family 4 protein [Phycisphaerales bacterium]
MRIVHIITRLIIGGAQENTLLSCEGQHNHGHEVTLITGPAIGPEGSLLERARSYGYRVEVIEQMRRSILPLQDWRTYGWLIDRLRAISPDIVHTHSSKAGIIGRWAAHRAHRGKIVHTIHGLSFTSSRWRAVNEAYKFLERQAAPITDKIVCVADSMRDQSLASRIGRFGQYTTIYSGMETAAFVDSVRTRQVVRNRLGIADDQIVVGTIARLFYLKGHEDLIQIAPQLCRQFPNLRFLWVGDGLLRAGYERQMEQLGLRDRFILTGMVPPQQVPELVGAMDIVAHPSRREGLARALPQGALAGKPVITYDIDGSKEAVLDGQSGFVLRPFDASRLAIAISTLVADESKRHQFGQTGRDFALARFDTRVMVDALEKLYQELLSGSSCRPNPLQM